jgi:(4S)-4-hydroxy-5-phosphonooxypentane-2,3-dione isomerase
MLALTPGEEPAVYQFAVMFTVAADHREHFIAEALRNARGSLANEPGCLRFDVLADPDDPLVFYFNEAYTDKAAVELHRDGENFQRFIKAVSHYADGPTRRFTGTTVEHPAAS